MDCSRRTLVVHTHFAGRSHRARAALSGKHGLQVLTMEHLVARLAGGFLRPIDPDRLRTAVAGASREPLGELETVRELPGFQRAAVKSLSMAWSAGLTLDQEAERATGKVAGRRLRALAQLERRVLRSLPVNQLRPRDLVARAFGRMDHAPSIFGPIEVSGHTEMAPVWRPLLLRLAQVVDVTWSAEAREYPVWLRESGISVTTGAPSDPNRVAVSCATPSHEILEALRWARRLLADGVLPQEVAIATASPEPWDDHMRGLADSANLPLHFIHGVAALSEPPGQAAAALAEVLLRGFSRPRMIRLVALLRSQCERFRGLPSNWSLALPVEAPLQEARAWIAALDRLDAKSFPDGRDHRPLLREVVETLGAGLGAAGQIGESLFAGGQGAQSLWRRALEEGPAAAVDITLQRLRLRDRVEPAGAIVWGSAVDIAAVPRPWTWLVGLNSQFWPRRQGEDPLLSDHIIARALLDPLPTHEADRRDFRTICSMTSRELVFSRSRRDSEGRLNGISPLYPSDLTVTHLAHSREAPHAASEADRLMVRPGEFQKTPLAVSARSAWRDWHREEITEHDGMVRADHPLLLRALNRRQSASSLVRLLRDPLGYLWHYGFGWREPRETEEALTLDPLAFGSLLHEILQVAVTLLETAPGAGLGNASPEEIQAAVRSAEDTVARAWEENRAVPPPILWKYQHRQAARLSTAALECDGALPGQRSWAEVPFGGGREHPTHYEQDPRGLPWDATRTVEIPETSITIAGVIDRLDLSGDRKRARVTDYKSGQGPSRRTVLDGGRELQRCLYAFATQVLIDGSPDVEARLIFARAKDDIRSLGKQPEILNLLTSYFRDACELFAEGRALPGPDALKSFHTFAFALPASAHQGYLNTKMPVIHQKLGSLPSLWDRE